MTKSLRKILLSVTAFLAVLFLGLTVAVSVPKTAKAEGELAVTKITHVWTKAGNHKDSEFDDLHKWGSLYIFEFNQELTSLSSYADGADVKSVMADFADKVIVGVNNSKLSAAAGGYSIVKYSSNALYVKIARPSYWQQFKIGEGATVNGTPIVASNWYEQDDWTFNNTAPTEFKIVSLFEHPTPGDYTKISYQYNMYGIHHDKLFQYVYINGQQLADENAMANQAITKYDATTGKLSFSTDWDASTGYANAYFYVKKSVKDNGPLTITFKPGFKMSTNGSYASLISSRITEEISFVLEYDPSDYDYNGNEIDNALHAVYATESNKLTVPSITSTTYNNSTASRYGNGYDITFSNADVLNAFDNGADITSYLRNYTNFFYKIRINGVTLNTINNIVITKKDATTVSVYVKSSPAYYSEIEIFAGLRLGSKVVLADTTYYQNEQAYKDKVATYTKKISSEDAPAATIFAVGTSANGSFGSNGLAPVHIAFNRSTGAGWFSLVDYVFINGKQVKHSGQYDEVSAAGEAIANKTWFNLQIPASEMGTPAVLTFKKGLTVGNVTLTEDIHFVSDSNDYGAFWGGGFLPTWTKATNQEITFKQGDTTIDTISAVNVTLPAPADIDDYQAGKTFIGWTDGTNLYKAGETVWGITEATTFKAVEISFEALGAQLRLSGPAGMRFGFAFDSAELTAYQEAGFIVGYGGLIARTSTIDNLEYAVNDNILIVESTVNSVNGENTEFYVGIWNMYAHNFNVSMTARGYLEVKYTNDANVSYVYSDVLVKTASVGAQEILDGIESGSITDEAFTSATAIEMLNAYVGK